METCLQAQISYSYLFFFFLVRQNGDFISHISFNSLDLKQVLHCMLTLFGHIKSIRFDGACLETERDVVSHEKGFSAAIMVPRIEIFFLFQFDYGNSKCSSFIM